MPARSSGVTLLVVGLLVAPSTGQAAQRVGVDEPLGRVVIGADAAYALLDKADNVVRIDGSGAIVASTSVPGLNIFGAFANGTLWSTVAKD